MEQAFHCYHLLSSRFQCVFHPCYLGPFLSPSVFLLLSYLPGAPQVALEDLPNLFSKISGMIPAFPPSLPSFFSFFVSFLYSFLR